jgi:hypothetical protein
MSTKNRSQLKMMRGGKEDPAAGETMHKGAYVVVRLFVEGEDAPAHDFAQTAVEAAGAVVSAGIAAGPTRLRVTLKGVQVDDDPGDEDQS